MTPTILGFSFFDHFRWGQVFGLNIKEVGIAKCQQRLQSKERVRCQVRSCEQASHRLSTWAKWLWLKSSQSSNMGCPQ